MPHPPTIWGIRTKANYGARAGETIAGNLKRGGDGKFASAGTAGGAAQRGVALSKQPKPSAHAAPSSGKGGKGKGGGKKGGAAAKPKKAKLTPEQRQAQHAAEQTQHRADVLSKLNIAPDGQQALSALRSGEQPDADAIARGGFEQAGLVERAQDGSFRLTASGRALLAAADAGDAGRAGDTISSARDRTTARTDRQTATQARHAEAERKRQAAAQKRAEAAKKKPSGGGGGGSSSSKQPLDDAARAADRETRRQITSGETAKKVGLSSDALLDLRNAADAGGVKNQDLIDRGLIGSDGMTTDAGRRALSALERGDTRGYQAALQDARAKQERALQVANNQQARAQEAERRRQERAQQPRARHKEAAFVVYKDASGTPRWLSRSTTAYRDRDGEILATAALDADSQRMTATKQFGPLRYWHVGAPDPSTPERPWGPGLDLGMCDFSVVIGRTRVESGTFKSAEIAAAVAAVADRHEMSPGFFHPEHHPGPDKVFTQMRTFERSLVPTRYGRASNLFTGFTVKEHRMDPEEMERRFKAAISELGLDAAQAQQLGAQLIQTEKAAQTQGIAFKSDDAPAVYTAPDGTPGIIQDGHFVALKAAAPPPPPEEDAAAIELQADVPDELDDGMDDEGAEASDVVGNMTVADFESLLTGAFATALAPLVKAIDVAGKMSGQVDELKSMFGGVATKEQGAATEIANLKAQQQQLAAQLAELEGDVPAVGLSPDAEAALKSAGPQSPAQQDGDAPPPGISKEMWDMAARAVQGGGSPNTAFHQMMQRQLPSG